jgi:hypothetical protein
MNYQGVVWQELFPERHYADVPPQRSPLTQRKELWQGLETYIVNSTRMHGFKACWKVATARGGRRFCARTLSYLEIAIADLKPATGSGFGALKDAIR